MSIEAALYSELSGDTAVSAITTAISPHVVGQADDLPYVTYQRITTNRYPHMTAASGLLTATIQINCWSSDCEEAESLKEAIRDALDGWRNAEMGSGDPALTVASVTLVSEQTAHESPNDGGDVPVYGYMLDFDFTYRESVPAFS